jgi:hypothetical protein
LATILEQYRVADFLEWHREKKLTLNPEFQRGSVWTPPARVYLIDTILRELPIPKIYIRTIVDVQTKKSIREVVDGQQRLKAIIDFAEDKIRLTRRAGEFSGLTYSDLDDEQKEIFLSYPLAVGQLLNASDDEVLEIFARLNSYSVQLNAPEKRHARFSGDFKWAVRDASRRWSVLWDTYRIVSVRQRVRMLDDSLMAEMFSVLLKGVTDGGQSRIDRLYEEQEESYGPENDTPDRVSRVLEYFTEHLVEDLVGTILLSAPHFLMLYAALAHALLGIPKGELEEIPNREAQPILQLESARSALLTLATVIEAPRPPREYGDFWRASRSSTQRISSRRIRFPVFFRAVTAR